MTPTVYKNPGQLPPFWEHSVVFFANILSLFYGNEEERKVLVKKVGTLETYGSRLIPILNIVYRGRHNLLVLEKAPEGHLNKYFVHDLKLSLPQIKIVNHRFYEALGDAAKQQTLDVQAFFHELDRLNGACVDGYVVDNVIAHIARVTKKETISAIESSHKGNDKRELYCFLQGKNLPTFDTYIIEGVEEMEDKINALKEKGYSQAVVKAAIGASGIGLLRIDLNVPFNKKDIPDYIFFEGPALVQGWLNETVAGVNYVCSPSVQVFLKHDSVYLYDVTEQILSEESVHQGNMAPAQFPEEEEAIYEELLSQAETASLWLHEQGYRGTGSIDFHVCKRHGKIEVRICEINARVTGATYPAILARHFYPFGSWLMRNIVFHKPVHGRDILEELDKKKLLYRPGDEEGILPFNFNAKDGGVIRKGQFLFLGAKQSDTLKQLEKMCQIESIRGDFDRD